MKYKAEVSGSQESKPADIENNGNSVYARANIRKVTVEDGDRTREEWRYEEAEMTSGEWSRMLALDTSWVTAWSDAMRTAERRARYERMDPRVSSVRRKIDLGDDAEGNRAKLMAYQEYCAAVTATREQPSYPQDVTYPDEPDD